ncbi:MAG: glycosyl hydrolase family 8, partial [Polyangia bacterium]
MQPEVPWRAIVVLLTLLGVTACNSPGPGAPLFKPDAGSGAAGGGAGGATGGAASGGTSGSGGQGAIEPDATGGGGSGGALPGTGGAISGGGGGGGARSTGGSGPLAGRGGMGSGGAGGGLGACLLPSGAKFSDAEAAYARFKTDLVTSDGAGGFLRVRRPNSTGAINTTNSEGIGYGMLAAVMMNDQTVFDQLWKYEQLHLDRNGLMNWEIAPDGTAPTAGGTGAATDGDEDMAFALVLADRRWGGRGTLADTYLSSARKQIDLVWQFEVDHSRGDILTPGDQFGGGQVINISYFAPGFYRVFGVVTGKTAEWTRVVESSYRALTAALNATNKNSANGLVPAWSTPEGVAMAPAGTGHPTTHQLDSSRTPFRVAQDYCWFNEPRALTYLQKITSFYATVGAPNIVDAYNLDGTPYPGATLHLAAFVGPAGVGAMAVASQSTLRDQAYAALITPPGLLGGSLYYNESWTVLSLLMM